MIPQHSLGRANHENGVRYRVAACRQRLRNNRTTPRATNHSHIKAQSPDLVLLATELVEENTGYSPVPVDQITYVPRTSEDRAVLPVESEEPEKVGIT